MIRQDDREPPRNEDQTVKEMWAKPEIVDYKPVIDAEGFISFTPGDGIDNLS